MTTPLTEAGSPSMSESGLPVESSFTSGKTSDLGNSDSPGFISGLTTAPQTSATLTAAPSPESSTPPPSDQGLADGAVAGVAIGCLIAGLIIGIICGWFLRRCIRSRLRRRKRMRGVDIPRDLGNNGPIALEPTEKMIKLENFILQATPDKEVIDMLRRLEVIIEQHVENCYHAKPIDVSVSTLAQKLAGLGVSQNSSGFGAETVVGWCLQPGSRRRMALQHVISHVLFSSIDCNSRSPLTMLPEHVMAFLGSIRPVEKYREDFDVMSVILTRWRTLSSLLLHPNPNERTPLELSESAVRQQAQDLANALDAFLHYFVAPDPESVQRQRHHLHVMIIDAAKLGYALFSHTSDWRLIYRDEDMQRRVVTCVGLEKLSHQDGRRLTSPQLVRGPSLVVVYRKCEGAGKGETPAFHLIPQCSTGKAGIPTLMVPDTLIFSLDKTSFRHFTPADHLNIFNLFHRAYKSVRMAEFIPAVGVVAGALRLTYHAVTLAIESGQVNDEIRRSLELVRTCERDLQHLVGLREEYLDILERKPADLDRVNTIIKAAHQGLAEVCRIVEKCRPEANQGRIPFKRRSRWVFLDSTEFHTQIPVVSSHHRAVLNEMSFLRMIALQAPVPVLSQERDENVRMPRKKTVAVANIALLGNLMGGKPARSPSTWRPRDSMPNSSSSLLSESTSDHYNARSSLSPDASAPPPYQTVDTVPNAAINPATQRLWPSTRGVDDTQPAQIYDQHMPYSPNRFLDSADIQAIRSSPNTPQNALRPALIEQRDPTPGLYSVPNLPLPVSSPLEDQPHMAQSQPPSTLVASAGSGPRQNHRILPFSWYSNASYQQSRVIHPREGNEVERSYTPAS
ncbi:hypothetical protein NM208_g1626 [Fusarium decemcellulare]|uniref:Uncharacterized protein n=1 Tax=Fusarium decemcellulare TaxID=57161 RepID=A0ACC1SVI9_9HYPO|nr:hypothetical protein NM208_g1626 [Fusarium decemcellulare]